MSQIRTQDVIERDDSTVHGIIDLPIRTRLLIVRLAYLIVFLVLLSLLVAYVATLTPQFTTGVGVFVIVICCGVALSFLLRVFPMIQQRRALRRVIALLHEQDILDEVDPVGLARRVHESRGWWEGNAGLMYLITGLPTRKTGITFRFSPRKSVTPIDPLTVSFEARLLDESEPSFAELWNATLPDEPGNGSRLHPLPGPEDSGSLRRVLRNIKLKEGGITTLLYTALFVNSAYDDYRDDRLTIWTLVWAIFLTRVLFSPVTRNTGQGTWFIVPRGILIRKLEGAGEVVHRHLDRLSSVLGVFQVTRHRWRVYVADESESHTRVATLNEVILLLRAWMSSVEPPSANVIASMA